MPPPLPRGFTLSHFSLTFFASHLSLQLMRSEVSRLQHENLSMNEAIKVEMEWPPFPSALRTASWHSLSYTSFPRFTEQQGKDQAEQAAAVPGVKRRGGMWQGRTKESVVPYIKKTNPFPNISRLCSSPAAGR